jgi:hypothetical protein
MKRVIFSLLTIMSMPLQNAHAWGRFDGGYHPDYNRHFHHDPVVIHREYIEHRGRGGCIGCGAAAVVGLLGGAIIGASIAANQPAETVVVEQAPPPQVIVEAPPYGSQYPNLPYGCSNMNINGATYYRCNQQWFQPYMGGNGVYYTLVPPPM